MANIDRMFIITGGPGSGKTSLIEALASLGLKHMPESGRLIIKDQVTIGGNALPWSDRLAFAELMFSREMRSYREAQAVSGPVIFDRGIPDVAGYLRLIGFSVPPYIEHATRAFRYHRRVFIAPPWPAIFARDTERKQSIEEAEATYNSMVDVYSGLGYELLSLPKVTVQERAQFVLENIG